MADLQRTIEIIFNAIDHTSDGLQSIGSNLQTATDSISKITEPLSDIATKAEQAELAVGALGAAFLAAAVNEAAEFGKKINEIGTLVNATPEQVTKLTSSVQDFSLNSTSSFESITQAVYTATSNFGNLDTAMASLSIAEKGAIVGATDLDTAIGAISRTMNAYGLATGDAATSQTNAERVMAALFVTVQQGDTTLEKLSSNIGKVAATASAANIPIETVGAAVAALTSAGISTDESMTKLNALIRELINPSTQLQEALNGLNVTTDGLPAVLDRLQQATGGSADQLFNLFSSTEAAQSAIILVNDSAGKFDSTLKAMDSSIQNFNKNVESMSGSLVYAQQQFENAGQVLLQKFGAPLEKGSAELVQALSNIFKGVTISLDNGSFQPVFDAFNEFSSTASDYLNKVAKALPEAMKNVDFSGILAAFDDFGDSLGGLFGNLDLTTPKGLTEAIQGVLDAIENLTYFVSGIVTSWQPAINLFRELATEADGLSVESIKGAGALAGYSQQFEAIKPVISSTANAFETLGTGLEALAASQIATKIGTWQASLSGWVASVGPANIALGLLAVAAGDAAEALIKGERSRLGEVIDNIVKSTTNSDSLGAFVYDLNLFGEQGRETESKLVALNAEIENLKQVTGDSSINVENYQVKLAAWKDTLAEANEKARDGVIDIDELDEYMASLDQSVYGTDASLQQLYKSMGLNNSGMAEAGNSAEKLLGVFNNLEDAENRVLRATDEGKNAFIRFNNGAYEVISTGDKIKESLEKVQKSTEDTVKANERGSEEWKRVQDVMLATQKQADDFALKMAELSEKHYEINVNALVDLKVAEIEAQTAAIQAAFDSINNAVTSTGDTLASLAETFANYKGDDQEKANFLKKLAEDEAKRRDDVFEIQKNLIEKQTKYLDIKTQRLTSGNALIKIESGGLAPELDALFDKILQRTQIKATEEGLSLLLGID